MQRILTITMNPAVDKSSRVENVVPEHKLRCRSPRYEPGGGGINVSRAIKELGGESVTFYLAGGASGQMLQSLLEKEGLSHHCVWMEGWTRENLTIYEGSTGLQFRFAMPGPILQDKEWKRCLTELFHFDPKPAYIVASGSLPPRVPKDFYGHIVRLAKDSGARVIVDTSGETLRLAARAGAYLIKPNMRELQQLAEQEIEDELQQEAVAMEIVEKGYSEVVVVSLGAAGALIVSKDGCERLRAPIVPIRSKVGAGDSMVAGIVLSLAQGRSPRDAVRFGVAAGSAAVMTPGSELCRGEDAERLYRRMASE
jgi:6-phosphofructokinase 2